jgi:hypothetical protein
MHHANAFNIIFHLTCIFVRRLKSKIYVDINLINRNPNILNISN